MRFTPLSTRTPIFCGLLPGVLLLTSTGCAVRKTTRVSPSAVPLPAREATPAALVAGVNAWSDAVRTMVAKVDLEPTAGSIYSGVIKEYHNVRGFILLQKPALIRMVGQAPVVGTTIFDMVSDGREFRLSIPPKQKFIVGKNDFRRPAKNSLENLRPQHILEALLVPGIDPATEKYYVEEAEEGTHRFYVATVLVARQGDELMLRRKVWIDRSNLSVARLQIYGPQGLYLEEVRYSAYQDFQGVNYPTVIEIRRPVEDYRLTITIEKATFNQPIAPEKFELKKPDSAALVELAGLQQKEDHRGQ